MIYRKEVFKTNKKENFLLVINTMKRLVPLEKDQDLLQISIRIAISAPTLCNVHVLEYKEICKSKLQALILEAGANQMNISDNVQDIIDITRDE